MPLHIFIHDLLNVLVQIANKIGLEKKKLLQSHALGQGDGVKLLVEEGTLLEEFSLFGETCRLHIQGLKSKPSKKQANSPPLTFYSSTKGSTWSKNYPIPL
jgi:hypothetical protein